MDLFVLIGIAVSLLVVIISLFFLQKKSSKSDAPPVQRVLPNRAAEAIPRRAQIARNQRNRVRNNAAAVVDNNVPEADNDEAEQGPVATHVMPDEKMGAKKRAKLEAKAEKRSQREQEMKLRSEKKARDEKLDEERRKLDEKEAEEERKLAEAERLARLEAERKENEEYMKLKAGFKIEEEGFDESEDGKDENKLEKFVEYIKFNKVVVLEDLAINFKLKTQQAISRITQLQADDILTGVIDDRGKFIYISEEELNGVANFLKQRGRVSISELAECSNKFIRLTPV